MVEMMLSELTGPSFDDNNFFLEMGYGIVFLLDMHANLAASL